MKTISLRITGKCLVPAEDWHWTIAGRRFVIAAGQQSFEHSLEIPVSEGWNTVEIEHSTEDHHRLHRHGHQYSYVNITGVYLGGAFCRIDLLRLSGLTARSRDTDGKELYLNNLGEPFDVSLKFFSPIEHWQFALLERTGPSGLFAESRYDDEG